DGNDSLKVNRADLTLKIDGNKVYGENTYGIADNSEGTTTDGRVTLDKSGLKSTDKNYLAMGDIVINVDRLTDNDTDATYNRGIHLDATNAANGYPDGYKGKVVVDTVNETSTVDTTLDKAVEVKNWAALSTKDTLAGTTMVESDVKEGFNWKNYNITTENTYSVFQKQLVIDIDGTKTYGEDTQNGRYSETLSSGTIIKGESGHTINEQGQITNQQYTYGITGLVDGETLAGLTNSTEQKTDKITLNTTNLKDGSGHTDTLLDAGTYTNKIKVDFTNSEILASDHFKKSNYTDKYANGTFIVEQRLVGVNTDAERVYGKQGNDMVIHDDTTGGADSSVEYSNKALFTGTQYDSRANGLTGLVAEDGSAFDTSTFVTKENSTSLDWLDVKYDADTKKVIAYEDDNNYVDEETNLKEKDRITT
ncbi:MAG: hypothetical protein HUJ56_07345, partial [Erysipelotrichaceae bacterium]|nr:hypothetical protein [Erysipelotrichaceae bacterium]